MEQNLLLEILAEECAEVIQIKSKTVRFGMYNLNPITGKSNRELLVQEIGDVMAMIRLVQESGLFTKDELEGCVEKKLKKIERWS